jgi:hypothetical protein
MSKPKKRPLAAHPASQDVKPAIHPVAEAHIPEMPLDAEDVGIGPVAMPSWQSRILWAMYAIWAVLVAVGIANHEQWRDEGSDWITVRHVGIGELFSTMIPQIGHPPLWYFLMYPLGNMGLPLVTVNIVSAIVVGIAMYFMLFRLRFPFYVKVLLVLSMFFVFEYPVVGRNYCLVVLFLMLTLWYYPKRFERPLVYALIVVCLYNTHSMVFPMAFAMMLLFFWEMVERKLVNRKTLGASLLMLIGGGYLIPYMALPGMKAISSKLHIPDHFAQFKTAIGNGLMVGGFETVSIDTMRNVALLAFVAFVLMMLPRLKVFAVFLCGTGGLLYLLTYKYIGQHRHHGLIMVEMLFVFGLAYYYKKDRLNLPLFGKLDTQKVASVVLAVMFFVQSYHGVSTVQREVDGTFSDGKAAAQFLMDNNLEHKILVGHQSWAASAVLQFLPADCKMYWADTRRWGYFIQFDSTFLANQYKYTGDYAAAVAQQQFPDRLQDVVLVMSLPIESQQLAQHWKPVYVGGLFAGDKPIKSQESFIIYTYQP